ncbi:MAG: methionyl-tRNA formyltransferase [Arenicellales bacterium]
MRVVFAGTPVFSRSSLDALASHPGVDIVAVYTQPDRRAGRGRKLTASPIKQRSIELGLEVYQPESFKSPESVDTLKSLQPDLMIVAAYGLILPQEVLDIPRLGCVNVHASLLPRWRGAAPIQRAIEAGDHVTGITLMHMESGLDTGPILAVVEIAIEEEDTGGSLHDKLSLAGGRLLSASLDAILEQRLIATPQQSNRATYAHKLTKAEAKIDWSQSAQSIAQKVRALNPWPIACTVFKEKSLKVLDSTPEKLDTNDVTLLVPGEIIEVNNNGILVATGQGQLLLRRVQKAGGKHMDAKSFANGVMLQPGIRFG